MSKATQDNLADEVRRLRGRVAELEAQVAKNRSAETQAEHGFSLPAESAERWESLVLIAADYILVLDKQARIQYINRVAAGYTMEQVLGSSAYDYVLPKYRDEMKRCVLSVLENGEVCTYESKGDGPHNQLRWYSTRVGPFHKHGEIAGVTLYVTDITELKNNEQQLIERADALARSQASLEEQKEILALIVTSIADGVVVANAKGEMLVFNPAAERLVGIGLTKEGPAAWSDRYGLYLGDGETPHPPESLPLTRAIRGETVRNAEVFVRNEDVPDGALLSVNGTPLLGPDGQLNGGVAVFRDITEQTRAQQTILESETRFRAFMQHVPAAAFIKDRDGRFVFVNRRLAELFDATEEELIGKTAADFVPLETAKQFRSSDLEILNGNSPFLADMRFGSMRGEDLWISIYKFLLTKQTGESFVAGIVVDVTERRQNEQRLKRDEMLLHRLIDLQERERKLVAHDIHDGFVQDVVGAKMIVDTIFDEPESFTTADICEHAGSISAALTRAISEARRLISELRPLVIDEAGVVASIRYLISDDEMCGDMKVSFEARTEHERWDPMLEGNIFRIVQEALTNARRHSQAQFVIITLTEADGRLKLAVKDDGVGFDVKAVMADRFGLRGISERARLFGGEAAVISSPRNGTLIEVQLPVTPAEE